MTKTLIAALAATALGGFATPAFAGECPAGNVGPNPLAGAATAPSGVTDTVLASVDLGPEIGVDGRQLRTRRLVLQPGGIVPLHSHADRPALIITIKGEVTEYRSTCTTPIVHHAGEISREAGGLSHWWKNTGTTEAVLLSSDVHHGQ
ncbi:MAG: cupin domain-containing protein [Sphingomonadaceae bacterium]|mgnify:FL=1|jgi:quercetin dioxygenase-like cupin family protein|uniref:cupin domain-containing protein n=1 Tax=Aquisediminimonas profunda TaxID=1550733 RepID=UPI001C6332E1|nr:cupin domain-containing protein [Aquisediminimonas profunda]